jgi:hypothetical protein
VRGLRSPVCFSFQVQAVIVPTSVPLGDRLTFDLTQQAQSAGHTHTAMGALAGLAVGAIAGYAIAANKANACHGGETCQRPYFEIVVYPVALGALGAVVGGVIGARWVTH